MSLEQDAVLRVRDDAHYMGVRHHSHAVLHGFVGAVRRQNRQVQDVPPAPHEGALGLDR